MAQVLVNIAGRAYRMACEDGQEPRLEQLARAFDDKIAEMKKAFGEIGDQRLTVMAAIAMADDRAESTRKVAALEAEMATLRGALASAEATSEAWARQVSATLDETSARIEQTAKRMDTR